MLRKEWESNFLRTLRTFMNVYVADSQNSVLKYRERERETGGSAGWLEIEII